MSAILGRLEKIRMYLPPVNAAQLKYFAALIMLIDHVTYAFLERVYTSPGWALMKTLPSGTLLDKLGRTVGRQAFPIFCFFLVEGFFYTRSRIRYFLQIMAFALVSQYPFQTCFFPGAQYMHANVLFTLGIGLAAIWLLDEIKKICPGGSPGLSGIKKMSGAGERNLSGIKKLPVEGGLGLSGGDPGPDAGNRNDAAGPYGFGLPDRKDLSPLRQLLLRGLAAAAAAGTVCGAAILARSLHSDYSYGGVLLIVLLYVLHEYRITGLFISWVWLSWYNRLELYAAPAFFLLACYNGQRGKQAKYFFYLFYPVHLTLLLLIRGYFFGM